MKAIFKRLYQTIMTIPLFILLLLSFIFSITIFMLWTIIYWIGTGVNNFDDRHWELVVDKLLIVYNKIMLTNSK